MKTRFIELTFSESTLLCHTEKMAFDAIAEASPVKIRVFYLENQTYYGDVTVNANGDSAAALRRALDKSREKVSSEAVNGKSPDIFELIAKATRKQSLRKTPASSRGQHRG